MNFCREKTNGQYWSKQKLWTKFHLHFYAHDALMLNKTYKL